MAVGYPPVGARVVTGERRDHVLRTSGQRGGADQRSPLAQGRRHHLEAAGERQPGAPVELVLRGAEERLAEAERDRPADDRQLQVAQRATDASARPTITPVRSTIGGGARCGGRPVSASIARPLQ